MSPERSRSRELFSEARRYLAGGVSSPVRAFRTVGGEPVVIARGAGPRVYDADGNEYIDYVAAFGPLILGHADLEVVAAVQQAAAEGTAFGATTRLEIDLASAIREALPSLELLRFVNSGTEATMSALRLARAFTGRDRIVKLEGCYHGHADGLLVKAGSGVATLALPDSAGVPAAYAGQTLVAPYNDLPALEALFQAQGDSIAALIVEPVAGNMGVVLPQPGYLQGLRELTSRHGALLIFDEVITGFRLCYGGAQTLFDTQPDLTCLGKIIGGGLPVGAYGGRREIMEQLAPRGPVYQAGTLSGNPLAMAAGIATLERLREPGSYERLESLASQLADGLKTVFAQAGIEATINRAGSMLTPFFAASPIDDYADAKRADSERFGRFFRAMLDAGVYLPPSQFEAWFVSLAHGEHEIEATLAAARKALASL
ncbi:MAG TPA: glutamate-1-semialdehyde 2,1-aminomutase [Dehalococcoidia bacterium]|nr:glutamate-1-semialdehyde 2,1-aminomutase [Dehalococcoidia bacterium]